MLRAFATDLYVGIVSTEPCKRSVVHAFDMDDTLTSKPQGFNNLGMTKDDFFDAARDFPADQDVVDLLRLMHRNGDRIAIATARPPERLVESFQWLRRYKIPFDQLLLSTGAEASGIAKQAMLQKLQADYRMVGTLVDDSPYNIEGARLQGIDTIHIHKNDQYWESNPEKVYKI